MVGTRAVQARILGRGVVVPGGRAFADEELESMSGLGPRRTKRLDRFSILALTAARRALEEARPTREELDACGLFTGNVLAGWSFTEPQLQRLHDVGLDGVSPYLATAWFPAAPQGEISIALGLRGYAKTVTTDRCAGAQCVGLAAERVRSGATPIVLAGGVEAPLAPVVQAAWAQSGRDPAHLVEGAAFVLLGAGGEGPVVAGHETFARHARDVADIAARLAGFLERHGARPDAIVCNVGPEAPGRERALEIVAAAGLPTDGVTCPAPWTGDTLATGGALAVVLADEAIRTRAEVRAALVLSLGSRCVDFLLLLRSARPGDAT